MKEIFEIITNNIFDENTVFIFPTEIAANLWLEKYITEVVINNLPYPKAVAKERFLSWDKFKTSSIKSTRQDKDIIPSIVRKIFTIDLIEKNKSLIKNGEKPLFSEIIQDKYADFSQSFADWLTKILPQLALWKKKYFSKKTREEASLMEEDYFTLYEEYEKFLEENNLFDSAWETPPFADEGKTYIIFYPESLSDFEEYRELLASSNHIKLFTLENLEVAPEKQEKPVAKFFDNSAQELHHLMLYIKNAHENQNIPYEKMAISLTDSEEFLPYIKKELEKYAIPYTVRIGKSMGKYLSGRLFAAIQDCYKNNFSFSTIQNLLTNESLFWKYPKLNQELTNFGIKNNCFCSFEEEGKPQYPFIKAFDHLGYESQEEKYYRSLQKNITELCESKSFKDLLANYWKFKSGFLQEINTKDAEITPSESQIETDAILGRAISELSVLLSLEEEKNFFGLKLPSCFDFFVDYITEKEYLAKPKNRGVGIYPYRVAAAAPFDLHIIPNATQKNLSVIFPRLSFMPKNLKEEFEIGDTDSSSVYLQMYLKNSKNPAFFSASTFSYSGYSIVHSLLKEEKTENLNPYGIYDVVKGEKDFWQNLNDENPCILEKITEGQKLSFEKWQKTSENSIYKTTEINEETQKLIEDFFIKDNKIKISATSMKSFYECPKKLLMKNVQKIYNEKEEAELSSLDTGKILHETLELFFKSYKAKEIVDFEEIENGKEVILGLLNEVIGKYKSNFINKKILESQKSEILKTLIKFLIDFTKNYASYKVVETELTLEQKLDLKDFPGGSDFPMEVYIFGVIDLILSKGDEVYILDYKTKDMPNASNCRLGKNGEDPSNFQLGYYTYLFESTKESLKVEEAFFISITENKEKIVYSSTRGSPKISREDFEPSLERIKEMTFDFAKGILSKNLNLPNAKITEDCTKCSYKKYCRNQYSVSGRNKFTGDEK